MSTIKSNPLGFAMFRNLVYTSYYKFLIGVGIILFLFSICVQKIGNVFIESHKVKIETLVPLIKEDGEKKKEMDKKIEFNATLYNSASSHEDAMRAEESAVSSIKDNEEITEYAVGIILSLGSLLCGFAVFSILEPGTYPNEIYCSAESFPFCRALKKWLFNLV